MKDLVVSISIVPASGERLVEPVRGDDRGIVNLSVTPVIGWRVETWQKPDGELISFSRPITAHGDQYSDMWAVWYQLREAECMAEGVGVLETLNRFSIIPMGEVVHTVSELLERFRELDKK
jgi:hypothetical protein